jgi:hypothetical protein
MGFQLGSATNHWAQLNKNCKLDFVSWATIGKKFEQSKKESVTLQLFRSFKAQKKVR